jgi:hypothetical protein
MGRETKPEIPEVIPPKGPPTSESPVHVVVQVIP